MDCTSKNEHDVGLASYISKSIKVLYISNNFYFHFLITIHQASAWCGMNRTHDHSCQTDQALNRQILEKKIVKIGNCVHGNRQKKKIVTKNELKVKKKNYSETFD